MEKLLTIGEVARLLNVPESTLRFWQEKGVFTVPKDAHSSYRQYTMADLIQIAEIAFYRNIGVPVKEMKDFCNLTLPDYEQILTGVQAAQEKKSRQLAQMREAVRRKRQHIKSITHLGSVDYVYGRVPFSRVVRFDYSDRDKVMRYTKNPSLYVRCMDTRRPGDETRGIVAQTAEEGDVLLWRRDMDSDYAIFLVQEIASEGYRNNISEKLGRVQQKHETGILLAEFLLSETRGGQRIDYLRAYVELL